MRHDVKSCRLDSAIFQPPEFQKFLVKESGKSSTFDGGRRVISFDAVRVAVGKGVAMDADKKFGIGRSLIDAGLKFGRVGDAGRGNVNIGCARHDDSIARSRQKFLRLERNA